MKAQIDLSNLKKVDDSSQSEDHKQGAVQKVVPSPFNVRSANQRMEDAKAQRIPNMLFSEFIFEEELTVLYAPANRGKSFLALQIAEGIASGTCLEGLRNEAAPQKVMFFDLEMSDIQFRSRYCEQYRNVEGKRQFHNEYKFHPNLAIAEFGEALPPKGVDVVDYYFKFIKESSDNWGAKVIFIDNISWLSHKGLEKMEDAKALCNRLKELVKKDKYAIIVLAHTPKISDSSPIELKDLAGSAGLGNFSDACFVINESFSQGKPYKYIKQNKCRSAIKVYDTNNVLTLMMEQIEPNFLGFRIAPEDDPDYKNEWKHLRKNEINKTVKYPEDEILAAKIKVAKAVKDDPEISYRKLETLTGVSHTTAGEYKQEFLANPQMFDGYLNPKKNEDENSF